MPPRKAVGATKKIAKTTRAATRRTTAQNAALEVAAEETIAENPTNEPAAQNPTGENVEVAQKTLNDGASSSSVLEPCSIAARNGPSDELNPESGDVPIKALPPRTTKKIVRKVTRKVPVRVAKKTEESVVVEKEKEPDSEPPREENADPDLGKAQQVEKKVRKVKKVVIVKKYVKKPKVAVEDVKVEEVEGSRGGENEEIRNEDMGTSGELMGLTECQKRRKMEIFVGGLHKDAKEEDLREVFGKVGEIVEVRLMIDARTGKNKGYAFLRYATPAQAKRAVNELSKAEVCGKQCAAAALEGNDTLYLGNIDRKWKKEDISKILHGIGIDKIDSLTLMPDPKDPDSNRGFAFLDFETNREAQVAFKKLQNKDAFGEGRILKVAWAEPYNEPDEEELEKVKAVFVEGVPDSWDENLVRECFAKYGDVEKIALSRNMLSAKRKDYAFVNFSTREAALSCVELFDKDPSAIGSQANLKVSIAKPIQKSKKNKAVSRTSERDSFMGRPAPTRHQSSRSSSGPKAKNSMQGQPSKGRRVNIREDNGSSYRDFPHIPRERASWREMNYPREPDVPDYGISPRGGKRTRYALEEDMNYDEYRTYPRSRMDVPYPGTSPSYGSFPHNGGGYDYYHRPSYDQYGVGPSYGGTLDVPYQYPPYGRSGNPPYRAGPYTR
ncbi:uncharacterized protein LOC144706467 [Wolffia australiana]